ncbi:NAD(P)-binding protein [Exidia glandulosa HHB12029]|uniref:NAD(P)-binding protein n=1 Tax=Exidia glandulosa HHB12029 TaxID=1314781 RepID=A0A165LL83_EXIGL|nr:NAD(P)-binding protein [Exidia glandulosa HHB12029]
MASTDTPEKLLQSLSSATLHNLDGLVAVVTGGSTGIGLMITTTLLANGARVYIIGLDQKQVDGVVAIYDKAVGGRLVGLAGDVSKKEEAKRLAAEVGRRESYVNVLFNNAGVVIANLKKNANASVDDYVNAFDTYSESDFHSVSAVNTFAMYFMSIAFLKLLDASKGMRKKFPPQIVITSSINAWSKMRLTCVAPLYDPDTAGRGIPYLLSKSAAAHLTKVLAHEFLPLQIRVNGIAPGYVFSYTTGDLKADVNALGFPDISREQCAQEIKALFDVPFGKSGGHTDMGKLALMLVTNEFINGEIVLIDGGTLLLYPAGY